MRELKLLQRRSTIVYTSRTPPGVRELKQDTRKALSDARGGRTPPGVRELKHADSHEEAVRKTVAPLPGCVN